MTDTYFKDGSDGKDCPGCNKELKGATLVVVVNLFSTGLIAGKYCSSLFDLM